MKKSLAAALTTAIVAGTSAVTFAAANPFSDVPADSWAYDAVTQLAADGIIDGYPDGTFRGQRDITRYEMAQMVAKAVAREDQANAADKAMIDKLAAEFSNELNNLGVRVSNLENKMDNVKWTGEVRYSAAKSSADSRTVDNADKASRLNELEFRLYPEMQVNNNWKVKARIQGDLDFSNDAGEDNDNSLKLKEAYAEGNYGTTTYKAGKMNIYSEQGVVLDNEMSAASVTVGQNSPVSGTIFAGRINSSDNGNGLYGTLNQDAIKNAAGDWLNRFSADTGVTGASINVPSVDDVLNSIGKTRNLQGLNVKWAPNDKFSLVGEYFRKETGSLDLGTVTLADSTTRNVLQGTPSTQNIWGLGVNYKFDNNVAASAGYWKNSNFSDFGDVNTSGLSLSDTASRRLGEYKDTIDKNNKAYNIEVDYKGAQQENKGSFGVYAAYRYLGVGAVINPTFDAAITGAKGWEIGGNYTFTKNVVGELRYFDGKYLIGGDHRDTAKKIFGRVTFFF